MTTLGCKIAAALARKLVVVKKPLYEHKDIWAEEVSATTANAAEWSFGDGAAGFVGIPTDSNWEVVGMAFHADVFANNARINVNLVDYTTPNAGAPVIASIALNGASDGGGGVNNAKKYVDMTLSPLPVPNGAVLGFMTTTEAGNISDARVYTRLRRKIGEYVSDVSLV